MKLSIRLFFSFILISIFSTQMRASNEQNSDSLRISQIVSDFYTWYLHANNNDEYSEYKPRFVSNESGMVTLDYSNYIKNLRKYQFTDSLVIKEIRSYQDCIKNLKDIKYSDFGKKVFLDLDEFEGAQCDFGNYYRWTGGQELIDGIRIKNIIYINPESVIVTIDYYEEKQPGNEKLFFGENKLELKRMKNQWDINNIDSWENK